jgi:hypothetical protein
MYYYLLYNSSFSFIVENRIFSTILYGSILYILTHAILNYCDVSILTIINNYFWTTLTLDIISITYAIYNTFMNNTMNNTMNNADSDSNLDSGNTNSMNVSFNLLKNKINTMLDRKNDLTITQIPNTNNIKQSQNQKKNQNQNNIYANPKNKVQIQEHFNNVSQSMTNSMNDLDFSDLDDSIQGAPSTTSLSLAQTPSQFSTPIKNLQSNSNSNSNNGSTKLQASTPISLIRNNGNGNGNSMSTGIKIEPPIIQDESFGNGLGNGNESVAGSDVGSIMDLEDFENSF